LSDLHSGGEALHKTPKIEAAAQPVPQRPPASAGADRDQWYICLLAHLTLPLIPLLLELWIAKSVALESLYLVAAIYAVSISVSSRRGLGLLAGVVLGLVLCAGYGVLANQRVLAAAATTSAPQVNAALMQPGVMGGRWFPAIAILVVFILHAIERYKRHVNDKERYWPFVWRMHDDP
jgi:hypothetical protein